MTEKPSLNLKCPYPLVQRPPYAALELQRIQLHILVQTGLLTCEKLILFTQKHAKYEKHTHTPLHTPPTPKMDIYKSVFPMKWYNCISTPITILNLNHNFLEFRISLCTFFLFFCHKTKLLYNSVLFKWKETLWGRHWVVFPSSFYKPFPEKHGGETGGQSSWSHQQSPSVLSTLVLRCPLTWGKVKKRRVPGRSGMPPWCPFLLCINSCPQGREGRLTISLWSWRSLLELPHRLREPMAAFAKPGQTSEALIRHKELHLPALQLL